MGIAYIIASSIPIFGNLVSFIGAFFCPTMCMIPYGCMYLYDNWRVSTLMMMSRSRLSSGWLDTVERWNG